jgi:hypothetical protein
MTPAERARLVEEVVGAYREPDPRGGVRPSPAFYDLDETARRQAFDEAIVSRALEAALDPDGESSTVKAVLSILRRA